jgi:protein-arginine kinase
MLRNKKKIEHRLLKDVGMLFSSLYIQWCEFSSKDVRIVFRIPIIQHLAENKLNSISNLMIRPRNLVRKSLVII